ncbi:MAG: SRPBCC family protein [Chloroflexota bacterium]
MSTYEHSVIINHSIEDVFKNATCLKGCINWQASVLHAEQVGNEAVHVGSRYKHSIKFMGITGQTQPQVTVFDPPRRFAFRDPDAPVAFETIFDFEEVPEGTCFTTRIESEVNQSFLGKLALPIFLNAMKRQFDSDVTTLKELLESGVIVHAQ